MTPPTTKLVAMSALHVAAAEMMVGDWKSERYEQPGREILELVRSLESGEAVVVERGEIIDVQDAIARRDDAGEWETFVQETMAGWLTSGTPKEKATDG